MILQMLEILFSTSILVLYIKFDGSNSFLFWRCDVRKIAYAHSTHTYSNNLRLISWNHFLDPGDLKTGKSREHSLLKFWQNTIMSLSEVIGNKRAHMTIYVEWIRIESYASGKPSVLSINFTCLNSSLKFYVWKIIA